MWVCEAFGLSTEIRHVVEPLHKAPIFWLTVLLIVGATFVAEVGEEYIRITYYTTGPDRIRMLMKEKKGDGWNDLEKEVEQRGSWIGIGDELVNKSSLMQRPKDIR